MHQNAPGLQFLPPNGADWVDAPVCEEEFVVKLAGRQGRFGLLFLMVHTAQAQAA